MAEFGHRVNSEGLRRRAIAPSGGASKGVYIVFALYFCQPSDTRKKACAAAILDFFRAGRGGPAAGLGKAPIHPGSAAGGGFCGVAAPHCGHIPPPFLRAPVGTVAKGISDSIS
jgi:hypothetical protein